LTEGDAGSEVTATKRLIPYTDYRPKRKKSGTIAWPRALWSKAVRDGFVPDSGTKTG